MSLIKSFGVATAIKLTLISPDGPSVIGVSMTTRCVSRHPGCVKGQESLA